ncbi:MAG: response regulator [Deltaproteobacteria bacterium]|nr:response regulator [Deltaproteobacteria bacterium]
MDRKIKLLFVDDEEKFLTSTTTRLEMRGLEVHAFSDGFAALAATEKLDLDVALLDLKMPGMDGEELLKKLKERFPQMEVVILTGHGSIESAVTTTQSGAYQYLQKPCELDALISVISRAYAKIIATRRASKTARIGELMARAPTLTPLALLEELKKIDSDE